MIAPAVGPMYRRALALALLVVALAATTIWVVLPTIAFVAHHDKARQIAMRQLEKERAMVIADPDVQRLLDELSKSAQWQRLYTAKTPEEGLLLFQTDLRQILGESISNLAPEPPVRKASLSQIGIRLSAAMPMDRLAEVLQKVAQSPRFIRLQSMSVQSSDAQPVGSNPTLAVQLEAVAFVYAGQGQQQL